VATTTPVYHDAEPFTLSVRPEGIPDALRPHPQFVCWDWKPREGKWTKPPLRTNGRGYASSTDPSTWGSVEEAVSGCQQRGLAGIGFALTAEDDFAFVDIDHCRDPETGEMSSWAWPIVQAFRGSYQEVSPSGTGIKIIIRGRIPGERHSLGMDGMPGAKIELFDQGKYTTLTGHLCDWAAPDVTVCQAALDDLYASLFPPEELVQPSRVRQTSATPPGDEDGRRLDKARAAMNGDSFRRLFDEGDTSGHGGDHSRADAALASRLRFWCEGDPVWMDRLFRQSALIRDKWDEVHGGDGSTYGEMTIANALKGGGEVYQPSTRPRELRPGDHGVPPNDSNEPDREHSAERGGGSTESISLRFQTARQLAEATPDRPDWVVPGITACGAITEIDGKAKSSGKTTMVCWMVNAALNGKPFLGQPTMRTPVVYLTEQTPSTFRESLRRSDLLGHDDLSILPWYDAKIVPWPAIVRGAVRECQRIGAKLLVIDTMPQFAGLKGDAENSAGAALEALEPIQEAAGQGYAVVITRHDRKSGGEVGESARGSSAFGGGVDIIFQLSKAEGQGDPSIRILKGMGRYDEIPAQIAIQLHEGVGYAVLGDQAAATRTLMLTAVLKALPKDEASAMRIEEIMEATGGKKYTLNDVLQGLADKGIVVKCGGGVKGNPTLYWHRLTEVPVHSDERSDLTQQKESEQGADRPLAA